MISKVRTTDESAWQCLNSERISLGDGSAALSTSSATAFVVATSAVRTPNTPAITLKGSYVFVSCVQIVLSLAVRSMHQSTDNTHILHCAEVSNTSLSNLESLRH